MVTGVDGQCKSDAPLAKSSKEPDRMNRISGMKCGTDLLFLVSILFILLILSRSVALNN